MPPPKSPAVVDPNTALIETLLAQGFTKDQISSAQEQLWEAVGSGEGGYDDVWAVGELLRSLHWGDGGNGGNSGSGGNGGIGGGATAVKHSGADSDNDEDEDDDDDDDDEYETDSEEEDSDEEEGDGNEAKTQISTNSINSSNPAKAPQPTNSTKPPQSTKPIQSLPLSQKLQYVATDVPQLSDAIFALTEWTTKAASRRELERYFLELDGDGAMTKESVESVESVGPLRRIVQRVLLFPQQQQDPSLIIAGCANLLTCVLLSPACNVNAKDGREFKNGTTSKSSTSNSSTTSTMAHSSTIKKGFGELLRRGRALSSQIISVGDAGITGGAGGVGSEVPSAEEVAGNISSSILDLLQRASEEKKAWEKSMGGGEANGVHGGNGAIAVSGSSGSSDSITSSKYSTPEQAEETVRRMEGEINALKAKITNRQRSHHPNLQSVNQRSRVAKRLSGGAGVTSGRSGGGASGHVVVDLMTRRDRTKQIAETSGMVLEISAGCKRSFAKGGNGEEKGEPEAGDAKETVEAAKAAKAAGDSTLQTAGTAQPLLQSEEAKVELITKLIGPSLQNTLTNTVTEVQSLQSKIDTLTSESSAQKETLTSNLTETTNQRKEVSRRMDALRKELAELERQEEELEREEKHVTLQLAELERSSEREIGGIQGKIEDRAGCMAVEKEVRRAVEKMGELELAWKRSCSSSSGNSTNNSNLALESAFNAISTSSDLPTSSTTPSSQPKPPLTQLLPQTLIQYLHYTHTYLQTEATVVEFLRNRVSSAEADIADLEREIAECSALGMATNVETLTQGLRTLKSHVEEDNAVMEALRSDAKGIRGDLIRRVNNYLELMKGGKEEKVGEMEGEGAEEGDDLDNKGGGLEPAHIAALEGISIDLTSIGFYDDLDGGLGGLFSKLPKRDAHANGQANQTVIADADNQGTAPRGPIPSASPSMNGSKLPDTAVHPAHSALSASSSASAPPVPPPISPVKPAEKVVMPKFSWANKSNSVPKKETKSLLDIQREEMSAKEKGAT